MQLKGRTILITGGTSGIGLELARQLIARNTVIVTGRDATRLDAAKKTLPGVYAYRGDASDPNDIRDLHAEVVRTFPTLDTLINNAGIMRRVRLYHERALGDATQEIDIDLNGPIRMVQQFLPHLMRQSSALIVNVTSGLAFVPFAISPIYSAAKAGLHAYTRCLREQLSTTSVRVVELAPPLTDTPLVAGEFSDDMSGQKAMDVKLLAAKAVAGIEAGRTEIRPGQSNALKIASRLAPGLMFAQLAKVGQPRFRPS